MTDFQPRPKQAEVLRFQEGRMGVAAVPGSGKTWTLSRLAADLVASNRLEAGQEVLIVTLTNSAVDNFTQRVESFLKNTSHRRLLLPSYRVRTLHGLAHDIVRERPGLVGLSDDFQIIDERIADDIRDEAAIAWLRAHPYDLDAYLDPLMEEGKRDWVLREHLPNLISEIALSYIRTAKDLRLTPAQLLQRLSELPAPLPLAQMGAEIYADYQRALNYRGAVDFDDLIRLALLALESEPEYLERLRWRWRFILEDEAQDSSRLQQQILELLAGPTGNWVRVGDPNQAIFETFTTANPRFLREFIKDDFVLERELPNSGRSSESIIWLANYLIDWVRTEHPTPSVRDALSPPYILPAPPGDTQPNPPDNPRAVHLSSRRFTPDEEIKAVADSLARWLPENLDSTVAVLVPRNVRGAEVVDALRSRGLEVHDGLLRSTSETRAAAGALGNLLHYLANPGSAARLAKVFQVWRRADRLDAASRKELSRLSEIIRQCRQVEDYIYPQPGGDWLDQLNLLETEPETHALLDEFRSLVRRWQGAILLPVDQIVLTLAQDLFSEATDLAISHKLAVLLRRAAENNPSWRLPELTEELAVIARNERRFLGFSQDDTGFDPDAHKGKVVVATVHKAKGLEWDRLYLLSVNNYDFPSGEAHDSYIAEKFFLRDKLNLEAETRAQLEAALSKDPYAWYEEGLASQQARLDYIRERLRLLYVGITRARKELIVTWNSGRKGELRPAAPLIALTTAWEEHLHSLGIAKGEEK